MFEEVVRRLRQKFRYVKVQINEILFIQGNINGWEPLGPYRRESIKINTTALRKQTRRRQPLGLFKSIAS